MHLKKMGFTQSKSDLCIYISGDVYIGVYVDDMLLGGKDDAMIKRVKEKLSERFDIQEFAESLQHRLH